MRHETLPANPNLNLDYSGLPLSVIHLAGGCFWGAEAYLARVPGVARTSVGYANGRTERPTYEEVCWANTGHAETVEVWYDPARLPLQDLLAQFFLIIDPTLMNRQGNDKGTQYRSGIYYSDPADRPVIEAVVAREQNKYRLPIVTEVLPLQRYDRAEDYHQNYLEKNPQGYCHVSFQTLPAAPPVQKQAEPGSGTVGPGSLLPQIDAARFMRLDDQVLKKQLSRLQYAVALENATEHPFSGAYWREERTGLYVDVVTGEPLFSSKDKFDAGCGWPSFTQPVDPAVVLEKRDSSHGMERIEVRSRAGDIHLGHVFTDGPKRRGGLRYCINSASLRFIPVADLEKEGYGDWIPYFNTEAQA